MKKYIQPIFEFIIDDYSEDVLTNMSMFDSAEDPFLDGWGN